MKEIIENLKTIWGESKLFVVAMLANVWVGIMLVVNSMLNMRPSSVVVNIAYNDMNGYIGGAWYYVLSFAILGLMVAIIHNLIGMKIYKSKGLEMAMIFMVVGLAIAIVGWFVMMGVPGELI